MGDMGLPSFIVDQDVIKKDDKMTYKRFKYFFHETLEGGKCIAKAKERNQ
jgi:hypothetical protein